MVEGRYNADADFPGRLPTLFAEELPCVLIAKEEHLAYDRLLHIRETDELYRDVGLPADLRARSPAAAAPNRVSRARLRKQVGDLRRVCRNAYSGDAVVQTIAENVLKDTWTSIR